MTFTLISNDPFEEYFYKRAELADQMANSGFVADAYTLATAYLDALAEIWLNDFPDAKKNLDSELGGTVPSSIRLARLLKKFISNDPRVNKVAVVCFAEDWRYYRPQDAHIANKLLQPRLSDELDKRLKVHELPKSYLDISRDELAQECPELMECLELFALAEEYEYGALLYTFYRCPLVHYATTSSRTHGFTRGEEIRYYWSSSNNDDRFAISFGFKLVTCWLRNVVSGYVQSCRQVSMIPSDNLDVGTSHEKRLKKRWNKLK